MDNIDIINLEYSKSVTGIDQTWFTNFDAKWYDYVKALADNLRITYLIVVFHNQIFNGGFHQYFVNGYGQFAKETIEALLLIGASKKAELLTEALKAVNMTEMPDDVFRLKLLKRDIFQLFVQDELFEPLDNLDMLYYSEESEDVEQLLANYLRTSRKI